MKYIPDFYEFINEENLFEDSINAQSFKPKTNESCTYEKYVPSVSELIAEQHKDELDKR